MYVTVLSITEGRILKHMQTILLESEKLKTACRQAAEKGELRRRSRRSHAVSSRDEVGGSAFELWRCLVRRYL